MTKTKEGALKAARKLYGAAAVEGVDFTLTNTGAGWEHSPRSARPSTTPKAKQAKGKASPKAPASTTRKARRSAAEQPIVRQAEGKSFAPVGETKTELLTRMMKSGGATSKQMEAATGWAPHSVRGLLGTLRKRGITINSHKTNGEPTIYSIKPDPVGDVI
jgi:hypothetical protein